MSKPEQKVIDEEESKATKGQSGLLKRIEVLDESKKQLLESILDKIEKGELNKDILLNLEFLNIKKKQGMDQVTTSDHL